MEDEKCRSKIQCSTRFALKYRDVVSRRSGLDSRLIEDKKVCLGLGLGEILVGLDLVLDKVLTFLRPW